MHPLNDNSVGASNLMVGIKNSRKKAISLMLWILYFPKENILHHKNRTFNTWVSNRIFNSRFSWPWIMPVQRVTLLFWKYLLVKEIEFCWWKVPKFLLASLFAKAWRVYFRTFRVENRAILRRWPRKLIFLLFSTVIAAFSSIVYTR